MIEAELKARVHDVDAVAAWLTEHGVEEVATYHDTYYDWPDHSLTTEQRELRLRTITTSAGTRHLLTFKEPPADVASGSKPEHETELSTGEPVETMLRALGLVERVRLTKHCRNYRFDSSGRTMLATLVTVPELDGSFLELETITSPPELAEALAAIRSTLAAMGLGENDLEHWDYTDAVLAAREDT